MDNVIRACFPHATFRPGQFEFIKEAIQAFEGGAKNVVVEAPTGTGKTPAIIAIAKYFTQGFAEAEKDAKRIMMMVANERDALAQAQIILSPHQAHLITSLKMLQDQYLRDDRIVQIMKGKNNYTCHSASGAMGASCSDHEIMFGSVCRNKKRPCTYIEARGKAQLARLTLHNFDSFLNQVSLGGSFPPRALLSIDEAHGADDHLIAALAFELSPEALRKLEVAGTWRVPADCDDAKAIGEWLGEHDRALKTKEQELDDEVKRLQGLTTSFLNQAQEKQLAAHARRKNSIADIRRRLGRYLASADRVPWAVERQDNGAVTFEPVKSSFFAKAALLDYGERRVFMSATIFDKGRRLMSALNLKRDETHYIAVPSIFPVANRHVADLAVADTGKTGYEQSKTAVFSAIKQILARHAGERGVIHCNSYSMAKDIAHGVASLRLMTHESSTRDTQVSSFMATTRPDAVLVGVFLREGYDFKDDIARFQIIVRLPYAWPDKRTKMRDDLEKGYYDWLCAIDLVQTVGRGVRNETDHCITYVLDARLKRFLKRAGYMMPAWFLDSVKPASELGITLQLPTTTLAAGANDYIDLE